MISLPDLVMEIIEIRHKAKKELKRYHQLETHQNTYGVGFECGVVDTCSRLVQLIKDSKEDNK